MVGVEDAFALKGFLHRVEAVESIGRVRDARRCELEQEIRCVEPRTEGNGQGLQGIERNWLHTQRGTKRWRGDEERQCRCESLERFTSIAHERPFRRRNSIAGARLSCTRRATSLFPTC